MAEFPAATASDSRGRSDLEIDNADLPDSAAALAKLLAARPMLFDRGGPARLAHDAQRGGLAVDLLTISGIINECHQVARPFRWRKSREGAFERDYKTLPEQVARLYLDLRGRWGLRPLDGIASAPLLTDAGGMRVTDGYDPSTRLWCERMPEIDVPAAPTQADAEAALSILRKILMTFPFGDAAKKPHPETGLPIVDLSRSPEGDESAALHGLLTAVCRQSLWTAPGMVVRAPAFSGAGTGKGLLCRALCALAFGQKPQAMTAGGTPEELDKRLAAALIGASPVLFLDNMNGLTLRSDLLASVMTERPCHVRPLGQSSMVPLNSSAFLMLTGNGLSLSEDLARRFLVVELDAGLEDPEQRQFSGDLVADVLANRADLLTAALTIWRWGRQNRTDLTKGLPLGSFDQWTAWVRDPLLTLGCHDPAERVAETKANDPRRRTIVELFKAWSTCHGDAAVTAAGLAETVRAVIDPCNKGRQFIAASIRKLEGTRAAGFLMVRHVPAGKWSPDSYQLMRTTEASGIKTIGGHRGASGSDAAPIPMPPMTPYASEAEAGGEAQIDTGWAALI